MTYYTRWNIGDTVAYVAKTDGGDTMVVATVTGISFELKPYTGRERYALSSGVVLDRDEVLSQREARGIDETTDEMFRALEDIGARIAEMGNGS